MENPNSHESFSKHLKRTIRGLLNLKADKAPEEETIASIRAGIDFRGANLWILIFAIFVASLGLNTNSAAVIIGAMLISPLMGPIVGIGLSVGIYDFEMLKRAFRSFVVATLFSVMTATFYFAITPIAEAQSELLARTSPTIYDVLIAFFGGMAGIVALCSSGQRGGNVIPGVAIATALMPPLCTTGFGLATGNWIYAAGAFYLYLINSIFISLATFIGVNLMDFNKKVFVDKQREKRVKNLIVTIAVLTMLPAALLTYMLVKENIFTKKVNDFITQVITTDQTQVIAKEADYRNKEIRIVTIGEEISERDLSRARNLLTRFGLKDVKLNIVQGTKNLDANELKTLLADPTLRQADKNAKLLASEQQQVARLEKELDKYKQAEYNHIAISKEMKALFPEASRISIAKTVSLAVSDTAGTDSVTLVHLSLTKAIGTENRERIQSWLKTRLNSDNLLMTLTVNDNKKTKKK